MKRIVKVAAILILIGYLFSCVKKVVPPPPVNEFINLRDTVLPNTDKYLGRYGFAGLDIDQDSIKDIFFEYYYLISGTLYLTEFNITVNSGFLLPLSNDTLACKCYKGYAPNAYIPRNYLTPIKLRFYFPGEIVETNDTSITGRLGKTYYAEGPGANQNPRFSCGFASPTSKGSYYIVVRKVVDNKIAIAWIELVNGRLRKLRKFKFQDRVVLP